VDGGGYCLADPGRTYAVYLPMGRAVKVTLLPGTYEARWYNPRNGQTKALPRLTHAGEGAASPWAAPEPPDQGDWALLLTRTAPPGKGPRRGSPPAGPAEPQELSASFLQQYDSLISVDGYLLPVLHGLQQPRNVDDRRDPVFTGDNGSVGQVAADFHDDRGR